jgi:hypothetical protein
MAARSLSRTLRTVCLLLADFAHFALALDRRVCHQWLDAELAQGFGHFLHFGGAPLAVDRHPFQVVRHDPCPIEPGIIVAHRCGDLIDDTGARRRQKALERERLDALDHHAAHHFDRRRGADLCAGDAGAHAEASKRRRDGLTVRSGNEQRRLMACRVDRRQHGNVNIARGGAEHFGAVLLAAGRHRIDVEEERVSA